MYEFWHDYVKPNYDENAKLCYVDTDSFIVHVKIDDIYKGIAEDMETRFETSNFEVDRPLPKWKKWKSNWTNKKWITCTNGLRAKTYSYLKENNEDKKAKDTKKCIIKKT